MKRVEKFYYRNNSAYIAIEACEFFKTNHGEVALSGMILATKLSVIKSCNIKI